MTPLPGGHGPAIPEILPIFPLPNVVFFPSTLLPLHIFEPRYRAMTQAALASNAMIVMALLDSEAQVDSAGNPPVFPVACAGHIIDSRRLPDGRYDLVLSGVARVGIVEEVPSAPFRRARVRPLPENRGWLQDDRADEDLDRILLQFREIAGGLPILVSELKEKRDPAAREILLNTLSLHLDVLPEIRQKLLEEGDLGNRMRRLGKILSRSVKEKEIMTRFRDLAPDDPTVN
jgi:Lon protease-like protein